MENANNNNGKKLYLISFGNSRRYLLTDTESGEKSKLTRIESELNSFLRDKFSNDTFTYYTTPRVEEISNRDKEEFVDYPHLDLHAIKDIKRVLTKEVENMQDQSRLDSNSPFANVNPAAADIPNILG